jgi:hypothetical protein
VSLNGETAATAEVPPEAGRLNLEAVCSGVRLTAPRADAVGDVSDEGKLPSLVAVPHQRQPKDDENGRDEGDDDQTGKWRHLKSELDPFMVVEVRGLCLWNTVGGRR